MKLSRAWGWGYFILGVVAITAWSVIEGAEINVSMSAGLWFGAALFMFLAAFVLEPWYSGSGTAVTNLLLVFVSVIAADYDNNEGWWAGLLALSAIGFAAMAIAPLLGDRLPPGIRSQAEPIGRKLGSWRVAPLALLFLSLLTFNSVDEPEWTIAIAAVVYSLAASTFRFERFLPGSTTDGEFRQAALIAAPSEVVVRGEPDFPADVGDVVVISSKFGSSPALIVEPVVSGGVASWRMLTTSVRSLLPNAEQAGLSDVLGVSVAKANSSVGGPIQRYADSLEMTDSEAVGVSSVQSTVAELQIDLLHGALASVGDLFWTLRNGAQVYWQVTDAEVRTRTWPTDRRTIVRLHASQLGSWDAGDLRFRSSTTAPPVAELAVRSPSPNSGDSETPAIHNPRRVRIGSVSGSDLPIAVDPVVLGRHHSAILGVTGTGKTHLAFSLVDAMTAVGTRVLCADLTGQYSDRYESAPTVKFADLASFLDDKTTGEVGICDFTTSSVSPITQAMKLIDAIYEHVKALPRLDPGEPARFVVVLEEAHNFIPESFVVNDWDQKAHAQATSRVFMEAVSLALASSSCHSAQRWSQSQL